MDQILDKYVQAIGGREAVEKVTTRVKKGAIELPPGEGSGQLETLHVQIGDDVQKGQLLAEIDSSVAAAKVDADNAQLLNLQAQLAAISDKNYLDQYANPVWVNGLNQETTLYVKQQLAILAAQAKTGGLGGR